MINYIKGDLFKLAPKGAYLAHACNAQGVWGAGIAVKFKELYPEDFKEYQHFCEEGPRVTSWSLVTQNNIICLITSAGYGNRRSDPDKILVNTFFALDTLDDQLPPNAVIYSNKFNSGLFGVPWEHTEYFLKCFLERRPDVKWTVVEWTA